MENHLKDIQGHQCFISDKEPFQIMTAPFVYKEKSWKVWYVSCEKWKNSEYEHNIKYGISKMDFNGPKLEKFQLN